MAQLLSPVCTDLLKFQSSVLSSRSRHFSAKTSGAASSWCLRKRRSSSSIGRLRVATEDASSLSTGDVADDYYAVLGLVKFVTLYNIHPKKVPTLSLSLCFGSVFNNSFQMRHQKRSRKLIASWPSNTTPTRTPMTKPPRRSSRKRPKPTRY